MSATVFHESFRHESYQLPAGILALAVHGAFFALLYFGFTWQTMPLEMMSVELWERLPETVDAPAEIPRVEEIVPPAQPEITVQPDIVPPEPEIVLPDKKKPVLSPVDEVEVKRVEKKQVKKIAVAKSVAQKSVERELAEQIQNTRIAEQQAESERAEQAAAKGRVVNEYRTKIKNKITINVVLPPGVPDDALAVFRVTLLPGGAVLSVEMKKSSGNAAYDNAVERAIIKSDPLPLPPDPAMFKDFRVLRLEFQPRRMKE
ncbi:MAG: cell envelope integrity protein TolA [Gallionella sp.]|nr:cell envelope integrity protein TolA [Gallionella sp.]